MQAAKDAQRDLIAQLAAGLRLRRVDPWAEELTSRDASDLIEQLQLRRLSQKVNRPVTGELADRAAVSRELDRVSALAGERHGREAGMTTIASSNVQVRHVEPQPRRTLTARQERERRDALDRGPIRPHGTGRFSDATGYGAHASHSLQRAEHLGGHRDAPAITDGQERYIIDLQQQKRHPGPVATTEQAGVEIERPKDAPGPVTPKQAAYLADLQRKAGVEIAEASNREAAGAAITRLREQLHRNPQQLTPAEAEPLTPMSGDGIGAG